MVGYFCIIIFITLIARSVAGNCIGPPKDCSREFIKFFLYTCVDQPPQELIVDDPSTIRNAKFNEKADFKLLIHGYTQWKNTPEWMVVREEYFKQKPWNILVIDYFPLGKWGCYWDTLVPSIIKIGQCAGDLLRLIFKEKPSITIDRFHLVGFSMGSQICAQVSNNLKPDGLIIPRITGCDPAFPGFTAGIKKDHSILNSDHAKFVDVIHTNMGIAGEYFSSGHYDIYANSGTFQPGCKVTNPSCSHNRAIKIFGESINSPTKIMARKCNSKGLWITFRKCVGDHKHLIEVGEHCTPPDSDKKIGLYHFRTHDKPPFAIATPGI